MPKVRDVFAYFSVPTRNQPRLIRRTAIAATFSSGNPSSAMCAAIASRNAGSRSAKRISLSYFACSCRARKSAW